ncbi:thioesterase [Prauserella coralliicola]|nr:thioesterase [Prauserella coralliicola]
MAGVTYAHWELVPTRWRDNDVYGHVNNVVYYEFMDTVINRRLITEGGLDIQKGQVIGVCVESHCNYHASSGFPEKLAIGLRVGHLGTSSVRYEIGIHREDRSELLAEGHFVHVFVDRDTRRPEPVTGALREALRRLTVESTED